MIIALYMQIVKIKAKYLHISFTIMCRYGL